MGAETILFVGAHYEVKNGSEITQYYLAGTTRVAMRKYTIPQNMSVEYLLGDHPSTSSGHRLGSTSLTTDTSGAKVLEIRYKAWGEIRATWTSSPTTTPAYKSPAYTYTGQYSYMDDPATSGVTEGFGLMFYNARWYDPYLNHFVQADTIVPGGVQGLDRYAAMNNNPVRYNDPSGHDTECGVGQTGCTHKPKYTKPTTPTATPNPWSNVTVVLVCGIGTDCASGIVYYGDYGGILPLSVVKSYLEAAGATVVYAPGSWNSGEDLSKIESGIATALEGNTAEKTFLIGHSLGANGIVSFLHNNPDIYVNGAALLDPDLIDPSNGDPSLSDSQASATNPPNAGKMWVGTSTSGVSGPSEVPTPNANLQMSDPYTGSHTGLANNAQAAQDIYNFILGLVMGGG